MIDKIKSLAKNALNHKELIKLEFESYENQVKARIFFSQDWIDKFIEENKKLFNVDDFNPFEIQSTFDDSYAESIDIHQTSSIKLLFNMRAKMMFLTDADEEWFLNLYIQTRKNIQDHVTVIYKQYLEKIKEASFAHAFQSFVDSHSFEEIEDDDDSSEELDEDSLTEMFKKKIKGGIQ